MPELFALICELIYEVSLVSIKNIKASIVAPTTVNPPVLLVLKSVIKFNSSVVNCPDHIILLLISIVKG